MGATKNGRTVAFILGVQAQFTYMVNCAVVAERRKELMITISYEALFALIALCGGAGYVLGRDINKAKKVIVPCHGMTITFL